MVSLCIKDNNDKVQNFLMKKIGTLSLLSLIHNETMIITTKFKIS